MVSAQCNRYLNIDLIYYMSSKSRINNKRIARNTIFLYCRQLITMFISLYTVRVVLSTLGVNDYGLYNVIGGVVALFSFLSGTMASATQRFISYELGKEKQQDCGKVFSSSMFSYIIIAIIVLILAETLGLWFINYKLVIPETRVFAANVTYQTSIIAFIITLLTIPYNASIIAMEKMDIFAYISIIEAILKLLIAFLIPLFIDDYLITYSILMLFSICIIQSFYRIYCIRKFNYCTFSIQNKDISLIKKMTSFAGWNIIGCIASILRNQGSNILINLFFSTSINAAYGISMQINNAVTNFSNNFYTAVRPQLVKSYSSGDTKSMIELGFKSSRLAFFLLLLISVPIFCNLRALLSLWLTDIPQYTITFTQIIVITSLIEVFSIPLVNMLQACGRIKIYQIVVSVIYLMSLPVSFIFLKYGCEPQITLIVNLCLVLISLLPRLYICKKNMNISLKDYFYEVVMKVIPSILLMCVWVMIRNRVLIPHNLFLSLCLDGLIALVIILLTGLEKSEMKLIINKLKKK